jgi:hypothetical protein
MKGRLKHVSHLIFLADDEQDANGDQEANDDYEYYDDDDEE